jgi:hypothetical protein
MPKAQTAISNYKIIRLYQTLYLLDVSQKLPLMGFLDLLNHALNFVAPAAWVATLVAIAARLTMRKKPGVPALRWQIAINFIASAAALVLGLWFFGRDGKMATYTGMALLCATSQWLMVRGWQASKR